jgi:hypothetical protein
MSVPSYHINNGMGCISTDGTKKIGINDSEILVNWDIGLATEFDFKISKDGMVWTDGAITRTTPLETIGGISDLLTQVEAVAPAVDSTTLNVNNTIQIQNGESPTLTNSVIVSTFGGTNRILLDNVVGGAGDVLTSGGALGTLSWTTPSATPSLADVLDISPEGVANADQTITLSTSTDTNVMSGTGIDISTTTDTSTLTKDTLTITNGSLATTLREVSLSTTGGNGFIYVKNEDGQGILRTEITPFSVKVQNNTIQDNYVVIEPTQIGVANAGVVDYGGAGDVLTSGGGIGGLSWTTPSGTPSLDAVLNVSPSGEATADLSITFKETDSPFLTTRFDIDGINSTRPSLELQNDTLINIGTDDNGPNTITIGHISATTADYAPVNINGKFSINGVLFSGADGGSPQIGVSSFTIPQDGLRNSLYTLVVSGTANPTPINFPTNDTGGKYITIFNGGSQSLRCECSASPTRPFIGGNNGLAGATTYAIRANQTVQFLSAGASGFLLFAQSNPNSNVGTYPFPIQSLTTNQRVIATRITGASVNGTFTYTSISGQTNFSSPASVQLTAEDSTGNHVMTLRTNTVSGFTYVSSTGSFPTTLHIYALGN